MIEADKRKAIFLLHQEGMPLREIARRLHVSRNTVAVVIAQGGQLPKLVRSPKQKIDTQLLQRLYAHFLIRSLCNQLLKRILNRFRISGIWLQAHFEIIEDRLLAAKQEISRFPCKECTHMPGS